MRLMVTTEKLIAFLNSKKAMYIFIPLFVILSGILIYLLIVGINKSKNIKKTQEVYEVITPTISQESDKSFAVLFLGYGGAGHDGGGLSDSINVVHIDPDNKIITMIFVPRDLWVPVPDDWDNKHNYKINAAYSIGFDNTRYPNKKPEYRGEVGAGNLSKAVVSEVVGFPIKYYAAIDFSKFEKVIDILGGIEVNNVKTWDDFFYPVKGLENETCGKTAEEIAEYHSKYSDFNLEKQFTCRYEHLHFDKGIQKMDGATVLKFIRSRHSDQYGGDFARGEKQHAVLLGIEKKIISLGVLKKVDSIWDQLIGSVRTDTDKNLIKTILGGLSDLPDYKVNNIYITDQNVLVAKSGPGGQFILVPKAGENIFWIFKK
jgi:LCP family protein required for cell wall assembly